MAAAKILILPGDGIGPEIIAEAVKVLDFLIAGGLKAEYEYGFLGGSAYERYQDPYPRETRAQSAKADAVLLGAIGHPKYDQLERQKRPERGLLAIRRDLQLFANLRPARLYPELTFASTLKPEVVSDLDLLIVRELTGDIYFGEPRGIHLNEKGQKEGFNTMRYNVDEIRRVAKIAFEAAKHRHKKLCSVDKANVLETTELWREVVTEVGRDYPDVALTHLYVDNAAMQLVRAPKQFDVLLTGNIFGDILSDLAAMLTGSIGMLPSASLNETGKGLYEPAHGSAPDIAGKNQANPLATILSLALLLRHSLGEEKLAKQIEEAVGEALKQGFRTADILHQEKTTLVSCSAMGDAVLDALKTTL